MSNPFDIGFEQHVEFCRSRVWTSIYRPIYETNPPLVVPTVARIFQPASGILVVETPISEDAGDETNPVLGLMQFRQKRNATD